MRKKLIWNNKIPFRKKYSTTFPFSAIPLFFCPFLFYHSLKGKFIVKLMMIKLRAFHCLRPILSSRKEAYWPLYIIIGFVKFAEVGIWGVLFFSKQTLKIIKPSCAMKPGSHLWFHGWLEGRQEDVQDKFY